MKLIKGFEELLSRYQSLPDSGWIFIDNEFDVSSKEDILNKNYYFSEDDDEEIEMEDSYTTFLEAPTFKDIVVNKYNNKINASRDELISAVIYYLDNDDFLD
ncbi:hypothetical protein M1D48_17640 [Erwinia sp. D4-22]